MFASEHLISSDDGRASSYWIWDIELSIELSMENCGRIPLAHYRAVRTDLESIPYDAPRNNYTHSFYVIYIITKIMIAVYSNAKMYRNICKEICSAVVFT